MTSLTPDEYQAWLSSGDVARDATSEPVGRLLLVSGPGPSGNTARPGTEAFASLPCITVAVAHGDRCATEPWHQLADIVIRPDDVDLLIESVSRAPIAATALALLLRSTGQRDVGDGLVEESATYSMLQASPEFQRWLTARPKKTRSEGDEPAVRFWREGDVLHVRLFRPRVHNALNRRMRDDLLVALAVARADPSLRVELTGEGPSFCAGGDLDEFGSFSDVGSAHAVRLAGSVGRVLSMLATRTTARIHGACMGSGIELPAFAGTVVAAPTTRVRLPELELGLIPGAGGTVSLPRRIGRHRTAFLGLTGATIGAATAHRWHLVDAIES
ncbi:MAG TPA: enoyl-CoA hydratase/isomerase family protein [Acidimicrobiia bacterium]